MFRNIAIAIYIMIVLIISGFAKASTPIVTSLQYDENKNKILVSGYTLDTCEHSFAPHAQTSANVAYLSIVTTDSNVICGMGAAKEYTFDLAFDVRTLGLPEGEYTLKLTNTNTANLGAFNIYVPGDLISIPEATDTVEGELVALANGQFAIAKSETDIVYVKSEIDLTRYVGDYVKANGVALKFQTMPVDVTESNDPFNLVGHKKTATYFVLGISSATHIAE